MTLLMNFDYSHGGKTSVPFKCRLGSYYLSSANNGEGEFFLGRSAFIEYLFKNASSLGRGVQQVYKVESISYSKIASGHLNRASVVLAIVGAIGGAL